MDKLYDPDNIDRFSNSLLRAVENNEILNLDSLLLVLKILVNGPPGERCQSFYNQKMPADRCIAVVLRAKSTQDALRVDTKRCEQLINMILGLPYLTYQLCRALSILINILSPSSNIKKDVAARILTHEDLYKFDLKTVQHCLDQDTCELELTMVKLCTHDVSEEDFLKRFDHWVRWCSQSSEVFQLVSGIFNELLRRLKCKQRVNGIIKMFVKELHVTCRVNGIDIVSLYPYDAQNLVFLLQMEPEALKMEGEGFHTILKEIRGNFDQFWRSDPHKALVLSTHFPQWNMFLE